MGRKRTHITSRVGVVDPGGVANLHGMWDWVGMAPRVAPESRLWVGLCTKKLVKKRKRDIFHSQAVVFAQNLT